MSKDFSEKPGTNENREKRKAEQSNQRILHSSHCFKIKSLNWNCVLPNFCKLWLLPKAFIKSCISFFNLLSDKINSVRGKSSFCIKLTNASITVGMCFGFIPVKLRLICRHRIDGFFEIAVKTEANSASKSGNITCIITKIQMDHILTIVPYI